MKSFPIQTRKNVCKKKCTAIAQLFIKRENLCVYAQLYMLLLIYIMHRVCYSVRIYVLSENNK